MYWCASLLFFVDFALHVMKGLPRSGSMNSRPLVRLRSSPDLSPV
jgi:hypothetical protein